MPTDNEYSLTDLADLVGVTPRTVRYYIAQGLLPSPDKVGPAARYTEGHLDRLRLIRRLQREHLPLAEIRTRLEPLDDDEVRELLGTEPVAVAGEPAIDYIRSLLAKSAGTTRGEPAGPPQPAGPGPVPSAAHMVLRRVAFLEADRAAEPDATPPTPPPKPPPQPVGADRSQWDRVALTPDIELHVRRPLSRLQNKQVDRLIAIARELLEGDQS